MKVRKVKRENYIKKLALCALFTTLIIAGAFIRIPVPLVPFTMQFFFTCLAGLLLGGKLGCACVCMYVFLGLTGLPVFTAGGGIAYVLQPTFGYLIGFAFGTLITGIIAEKGGTRPSYKRLFAAVFSGLAVVYVFGMSYVWLIGKFYLGNEIGFWALLLSCVLLCAPGDILLSVICVFVARRLMPILRAQKEDTMDIVQNLKNRVLQNKPINRKQALLLYDAPLKELCEAADEIRKHFCSDSFDLCTIINAKSGKCSENCKFCAQSAAHQTEIKTYPLLDCDTIVAQAKRSEKSGVLRFSIVTSGRSLSDRELEEVCSSVRAIKEQTKLSVCVSAGLLSKKQFLALKEAGVSRIHNNLETSAKNFKNICSTHSFKDKIKTIKYAQKAGLAVCSGGIVGMGESKSDRIDMALTLRRLNVLSLPVNILHPIDGTPLQSLNPLSEKELCRIVAVFRFLLPRADIRLAGGRGALSDRGEACFRSGANAAISGDMLTTSGIDTVADLQLIDRLSFKRRLCDE